MAVRWREEVRGCPICGADRAVRLGWRGGEAHHAGRGVKTGIVRCRRCHGVYQHPFLLPDANPYADYAASEYFPREASEARVEAGRTLAARTSHLLGRTGRLIELGCGRGERLHGARLAGWQVQGIEMSDWPAVSPGLPIERAPVETAASLSERYDAAWLPAILEHLYAPAPVLQRVHAALVPGGLVFIDVPNECGLWQRVGNLYMALRGRRWAVNLSPTFPPFHVVGFCPRSLRLLLARCGFEVVGLRTHRWQNELPPSGTLWRRAERAAAEVVLWIGAKVGAGAGITCWARKPQ